MARMVSMRFHPWGTIEVPEGHIIREVDAACGAESHSAHPRCMPGWEKNLPEGAVVVADPVLDPDSGSGWIALVAIPPGAPLVGRPPAELRILASRLREDAAKIRETAEWRRRDFPEYAELLLSLAGQREGLADIAETGLWPPEGVELCVECAYGLDPEEGECPTCAGMDCCGPPYNAFRCALCANLCCRDCLRWVPDCQRGLYGPPIRYWPRLGRRPASRDLGP
jgi:hypothetical protein